jgi:threonine dehydrogenase-like Zn-dependent dehydrogenase
VIAIDTNRIRLTTALDLGATDVLETGENTGDEVRAMTDGLGVDVGLVDTVSIPTLLTMVASGRIPAEKMGTHTFGLDQLDEAYAVFGNAAANDALTVVVPARPVTDSFLNHRAVPYVYLRSGSRAHVFVARTGARSWRSTVLWSPPLSWWAG